MTPFIERKCNNYEHKKDRRAAPQIREIAYLKVDLSHAGDIDAEWSNLFVGSFRMVNSLRLVFLLLNNTIELGVTSFNPLTLHNAWRLRATLVSQFKHYYCYHYNSNILPANVSERTNQPKLFFRKEDNTSSLEHSLHGHLN